MGVRARSKEGRKAARFQRISEAWKRHYRDLLSGELTLAELLQHSDEKLMQVADIGLQVLKAGKYDLARKILTGLPLLDPYVPYFHLLLGTLHEKLQETDEALAEYVQVVELCESMDPPGSLLPYGLVAQAKLLVRLRRLEEAFPLVRRTLSGKAELREPKLRTEAQAMLAFLDSELDGAGRGA